MNRWLHQPALSSSAASFMHSQAPRCMVDGVRACLLRCFLMLRHLCSPQLGTRFEEMDTHKGPSRTTRGVWVACSSKVQLFNA